MEQDLQLLWQRHVHKALQGTTRPNDDDNDNDDDDDLFGKKVKFYGTVSAVSIGSVLDSFSVGDQVFDVKPSDGAATNSAEALGATNVAGVAAGAIDLGTYSVRVSVTDNESLSYQVPEAGTYYLRVYYQDAGNSYNLRWSFAAGVPLVDALESTALKNGSACHLRA